jgi:hypothetical protein
MISYDLTITETMHKGLLAAFYDKSETGEYPY